MQQNFIQNLKNFFENKKESFKNLEKSKKYAILVGALTIILAIGFSINYNMKNKYSVLFSGLDTYDAANISKELEDRKIDTKIKGDTIYVPTKEVDKLRLELSTSISNGSKGFELLDEGSSFSMTDEEFSIKKQRMLQGELEKTIKTFPQIEDARVHITQGEDSVFSKDNKEGKAAVYVVLKSGKELDETQIKSIMSLVSASCTNIPKQNIEVIDQGMTLLSEGIYDENGNALSKGVGLNASRAAEKELNDELQKSVVSMLEPIFGKEKVKATVNARLNFDTVEKTEIKIDPEKVAISETRSENSSSDNTQTGSPVDNNMSNTGEGGNENSNSKEEHIEYEVGKTETKTITTSGEVKRITASVAVDGVVDNATLTKVENMVSAAIGMDSDRGDEISVVSMQFSTEDKDALANAQLQKEKEEIIKTVAYMVVSVIILILVIMTIIYIKNKKEAKEGQHLDTLDSEEDINLVENEFKESFIEEENKELTLEEEIKLFASKNPQEVTELLKTWLNE